MASGFFKQLNSKILDVFLNIFYFLVIGPMSIVRFFGSEKYNKYRDSVLSKCGAADTSKERLEKPY